MGRSDISPDTAIRTTSGARSTNRWIRLILGLFLLYAVAFIYRTTFVVEGRRYFCLFDDAMVSMRYAKNLAAGHGLVFNPGGERVEGFTNPLWTLFMAICHLAPFSETKMSLLVQLGSLACLLGNLLVVERLTRRLAGDSRVAVCGALLLTAFYLPLNNWALQGMETGLLMLLVSGAMLGCVRQLDTHRSSAMPWLLLGIALLVRIDAVVPLVIMALFMVVADPARRGRSLRHAGLALSVGLGSQTVLRFVYYGDVLPNTYYLKMTGCPLSARLIPGLVRYCDFAIDFNLILLAAPLALLVLAGNRKLALPACLFAGQSAYSIWVGGDVWDWTHMANRFLCVAMPGLLVLIAVCADHLLGLARRRWSPASTRWRTLTVVLVLVGLVLEINRTTGYVSLTKWALVDPPLHVSDHKGMVERAALIKRLTDQHANVAVVMAGILPYFVDRPIIDMLGKNDRIVARGRAHVPTGPDRFRSYLPGHLKWDYDVTVGQRQPDVIAQMWTMPEHQLALCQCIPPDDAMPYLVDRYARVRFAQAVLLLKLRSPHVHWQRARQLAKGGGVVRPYRRKPRPDRAPPLPPTHDP